MRNPPTLTLTKESGEALTLMKGDEAVDTMKHSANSRLLFGSRKTNRRILQS